MKSCCRPIRLRRMRLQHRRLLHRQLRLQHRRLLHRQLRLSRRHSSPRPAAHSPQPVHRQRLRIRRCPKAWPMQAARWVIRPCITHPIPTPCRQVRGQTPRSSIPSRSPCRSLTLRRRLGQEQAQNLDLIMEVPLQVTVEIGRTRRKVQDILEFSKGTLVVLDKLAGDQVDLFVNGKCIARGDVVVIDDNFGVRITEIVQKSGLEKSVL